MRLPDFYHVGPPKTGTTGLRATLARVPGVTLSSIPEPSFFAPDHPKRETKGILTIEAYAGLFRVTPETLRVGDISPVYLHSAHAAAAISAVTPDARIVVCLRHPVERAFSHYLMWAGQRNLPAADFERRLRAALRDPDTDPGGRDTGFARCSLYAEALARFLDRFGRERVLVLPYDRMVGDPAGWMRAFLDHVGLGATEIPDRVERRYEGRGAPGSWLVHRVVRNVRSRTARWLPRPVRSLAGDAYRLFNRAGATSLHPAEVDRLYEHFRQDAQRLLELTGVDFDALWRDRSSGRIDG